MWSVASALLALVTCSGCDRIFKLKVWPVTNTTTHPNTQNERITAAATRQISAVCGRTEEGQRIVTFLPRILFAGQPTNSFWGMGAWLPFLILLLTNIQPISLLNLSPHNVPFAIATAWWDLIQASSMNWIGNRLEWWKINSTQKLVGLHLLASKFAYNLHFIIIQLKELQNGELLQAFS